MGGKLLCAPSLLVVIRTHRQYLRQIGRGNHMRAKGEEFRRGFNELGYDGSLMTRLLAAVRVEGLSPMPAPRMRKRNLPNGVLYGSPLETKRHSNGPRACFDLVNHAVSASYLDWEDNPP